VAIKDRKVTVEVTVTATDKLCARGRVIMVQIKDQN
jgi:metal-sulfur cluster biosynthetic enzyme